MISLKKKNATIIKKTIKKINMDDISGLSAQFAYYLILSLFPFVIIILYLFGFYSNHTNFLCTLSVIIPDEIYSIFYTISRYAIKDFKTSFIPISIIITLWTASLGSIGAIKGINHSYGIVETRGYLTLRINGLIFTIFLVFSIQIVLLLVVIGDLILSYLQSLINFSSVLLLSINILRLIISVLLLTIIFSLVYKFAPSLKLKFRLVLPGAIFSSIGWIISSYIFSIYVNNSSHYTNIYGNLSSIFVLIVWLYISCFIFLCGSELNAVILKDKKSR